MPLPIGYQYDNCEQSVYFNATQRMFVDILFALQYPWMLLHHALHTVSCDVSWPSWPTRFQKRLKNSVGVPIKRWYGPRSFKLAFLGVWTLRFGLTISLKGNQIPALYSCSLNSSIFWNFHRASQVKPLMSRDCLRSQLLSLQAQEEKRHQLHKELQLQEVCCNAVASPWNWLTYDRSYVFLLKCHDFSHLETECLTEEVLRKKKYSTSAGAHGREEWSLFVTWHRTGVQLPTMIMLWFERMLCCKFKQLKFFLATYLW